MIGMIGMCCMCPREYAKRMSSLDQGTCSGREEGADGHLTFLAPRRGVQQVVELNSPLPWRSAGGSQGDNRATVEQNNAGMLYDTIPSGL